MSAAATSIVQIIGEAGVLILMIDQSDSTITAMHLSAHSPLLLLGTAASSVHVLALPSLLPTRIIPPPPTTTTPGAITFLTTIVRPPDLGALAGGSGSGGAGSASTGVLPPRPVFVTGQMGRTVRSQNEWGRGGEGGRLVELRIAQGSRTDIEDLIGMAVGGTESARMALARERTVVSPITQEATGATDRAQRVAQLEQEVLKLRADLGRAVQLNESMWKKIVEGTDLTGARTGVEEVQR